MRNMVLLIDTNVILNYLLQRDDKELDASNIIIKKCVSGECIGYIAFHTISTLWYVLRKKDDQIKREYLKSICEIFLVASASQKEILDAIENSEFIDFEDCLQDKCAKDVDADYIITCNVKDYKSSEVEAITPSDFIYKYSLNCN